jgi:hypothetical protein
MEKREADSLAAPVQFCQTAGIEFTSGMPQGSLQECGTSRRLYRGASGLSR